MITILVDVEVTLQLFLERHLLMPIRNLCIVAVHVILHPRIVQSCSVFFLKLLQILQHEVIEHVCCTNHDTRRIIVIQMLVFSIDLKTMLRNCAKFKTDVFHQFVVSAVCNLLSCRRNINQAPQNTTLGVCNLNRTICSHKQHAVKRHHILRLKLFIHCHLLMRHQTVKS